MHRIQHTNIPPMITDRQRDMNVRTHNDPPHPTPPRYADLREGRMYHGDDEPLIRTPWLLIWGIAVSAAGLGLALLIGEPERVPTEPFINCYSEGC